MPRKKSEVQTGDIRQNKNGASYMVVATEGKQCYIQPFGETGTPIRLLKEIVKRWKLIETRSAA